LGASACLLARSEDINAEPLGVLSLATCRQDVQFSYGALTPIDDFLTTCLSLLFHVAWRESQNPNTAMRTALTQLETGAWSSEAQEIFKEVFTDYLPVMFAKMLADEQNGTVEVKQRVANCRVDWLRGMGGLIDAYYDWLENRHDKTAIIKLVDVMLRDLMKVTPYFHPKLAQFLPFWLWG
jgi:hypothetical protein